MCVYLCIFSMTTVFRKPQVWYLTISTVTSNACRSCSTFAFSGARCTSPSRHHCTSAASNPIPQMSSSNISQQTTQSNGTTTTTATLRSSTMTKVTAGASDLWAQMHNPLDRRWSSTHSEHVSWFPFGKRGLTRVWSENIFRASLWSGYVQHEHAMISKDHFNYY